MTKLTNVSIYNLNDVIILSNGIAVLNQGKTEFSFDSSIVVSDGDGANNLIVGESYYAVGLKEDNSPTRSETVQCLTIGKELTFDGSIKLSVLEQYHANIFHWILESNLA